jgi:hypothetical protein
LDQLTSTQVSEWEAYDRIDPIGQWREDHRWASLTAQMTNLLTWAHAKKGSSHTATDFIPQWDITAPAEIKVQSIEDMKRVFEEIAGYQNKNVGDQPKTIKKRK